MISRRHFLGTVLTSGAAFLGLCGYAVGYEPRYRLNVTRYDLTLPRWPADAKPLTMALVADIHACDPWMPLWRIEEIVAATNALNADIVLLLGDYVSSMRRVPTRILTPEEWSPPLGKLRAPLGVHAILGNHDYWREEGPQGVRDALIRQGITFYENTARRIDARGHRFWLSGTGSMVALKDRHGGVDDLPGTLAQITDDLPVIHMAHEPDLFPDVPGRVALTLSGHTHGGQIVLPFIGAIETGSDYGNRYRYGHIVEDGRHLIVSGGLGCSHLPIRLGSPPEIVHVTVRPGGPVTA